MSRNREFDQIFLRGSFDNGLVDGSVFAAAQDAVNSYHQNEGTHKNYKDGVNISRLRN